MGYLPDLVLNQICEKVINIKEADRPYHEQDILFIIAMFEKWEKFKIKAVEDMLMSKKMEKFFKNQG